MTKSDIRQLTFFSDGLRLSGVLHLPGQLPAPFVVGCHGLLSDKESPKQIALAEGCNRSGLAYFRFDHRGTGESEGAFSEVTSLNARCRDLLAAVDMLESRDDTAHLHGLFGSSMGGAVVLAAAGELKPRRLVTLAAPIQSAPVVESIRQSDDPLIHRIPKRFFDKDLTFDISEKIAGLRHILIFHGEADTIVPPENARKLYAACGEPKRLILLENGDHRISTARNQEIFTRKTVAWFSGKPDDRSI